MTCVCECSVTVVCPIIRDPVDCSPTRLLCPWDSPDKNTGVGCYALLQGIFPTQGSNSCLPMSPALQADSLPTEPSGKPLMACSHNLKNVVLIFRKPGNSS